MQFVHYANYASNKLPFDVGMSQGSVHGPLLFLVYINDITLISNFNLSLFADDSILTMAHSNPKRLEDLVNKEMSKINDWLTKNRLSLNSCKTNYMLFNRKAKLNIFNVEINKNP